MLKECFYSNDDIILIVYRKVQNDEILFTFNIHYTDNLPDMDEIYLDIRKD